jgi:hypothetical protein
MVVCFRFLPVFSGCDNGAFIAICCFAISYAGTSGWAEENVFRK